MAALKYKEKAGVLKALRSFLTEASLPHAQVERVANYAASTQPASQVDTFCEYLGGIGIQLECAEMSNYRKIRGGLVHAAEVGTDDAAAMQRFCVIVRLGVTREVTQAAHACPASAAFRPLPDGLPVIDRAA